MAVCLRQQSGGNPGTPRNPPDKRKKDHIEVKRFNDASDCVTLLRRLVLVDPELRSSEAGVQTDSNTLFVAAPSRTISEDVAD